MKIILIFSVVFFFDCLFSYAGDNFPSSNIPQILHSIPESQWSNFCGRPDVLNEIKIRLNEAKKMNVKEVRNISTYTASAGSFNRYACKVNLITKNNQEISGIVSITLKKDKNSVLVGWTGDGDEFDVNDVRYGQHVGAVSKSLTCNIMGTMYDVIAQVKHGGMPPEEAFRIAKSVAKSTLTEQQVKEAVNMVYFDPGFAYAGGQALVNQIYASCMNDFKPLYKPLK